MGKNSETASSLKHSRAYLSMAVSSHVGCLRENNEDNYLLEKNWNKHAENTSDEQLTIKLPAKHWLCAGVFDGMGGGERGEKASAIAAQAFLQCYQALPAASEKEQAETSARKTFLAANRGIVEENKRQAVLGTTGTVIYTDGYCFKVFHIGDSRAYLLRDGSLFRLTDDHTLAEMNIAAGVYSADAPEARADSHKLMLFLGADPTSESLYPQECQWMELRCQDKLLLCSDGLYGMCSNETIYHLLSQEAAPATITAGLIQAALKKGGTDNVTCLLISKQEKKSGK